MTRQTLKTVLKKTTAAVLLIGGVSLFQQVGKQPDMVWAAAMGLASGFCLMISFDVLKSWINER